MEPNKSLYFGSYVNAHKSIERVAFNSNEEEIEAELQKATSGSSKSDTKSILWKAHKIEHKPSSRAWRQESVIGRIVAILEQIIHLFKQLWPNRPQLVDQRLMSSLSSEKTIERVQMGGGKLAPLSQTLKYIIRFCKKNPDCTPDAQMLSSLEKCGNWASKLEAIEKLTNTKKREKLLRDIAAEISAEMTSLKHNETCIVPGGWMGTDGAHFALYQITRNGDEYEFKIISRDPHVHADTPLASAGKFKIYPESTFQHIKLEEINKPEWLTSLLRLQLEKPMDDAKGQVPHTERASLCNLLKHLEKNPTSPEKSRLVQPTIEAKKYRASRNISNHAKNIWALIDLTSNPNLQTASSKVHRRLKLKINSLFEFFEVTHRDLKNNETNRILLKEGVANIGRLATLLAEKGEIDDAELAILNHELGVIENYVKKAEGKTEQIEEVTGSPFLDTSSPPRFHFKRTQFKPTPFTPKTFTKETLSSDREGTAIQYPSNAPIAIPQRLSQPKIDLININETLDIVLNETRTLIDNQQDFLAQERIIDVIRNLPLGHTEEFRDSLTIGTEENRKKLSNQLAELSRQLSELTSKNHVSSPEHILALYHAGILQMELARIDSATTGYTYQYSVLAGYEKYLDLCIGDFTNRYEGIIRFTSRDTLRWYKQLKQYDRLSESYECKMLEAWRTDNQAKLNEYQCKELEKKGHKVSPELRQLERHHDFEAFKTLRGAGYRSAQIANLEKQFSYLERITETKLRDGTFVSIPIKYDLRSKWNKPFDNKILESILLRAEIHQGHESRPFASQERICAYPMDVSKTLVNLVEKFTKIELVSTDDAMPKLTPEEMRDLLLCFQDGISLWQLLGLFRERPHLLEIPDLRNMFEQLILQKNTIWAQSSLRQNLIDSPEIVEDFSKFTAELIEIYKNQGKVLPALFLMDLQQKFQKLTHELTEALIIEYTNAVSVEVSERNKILKQRGTLNLDDIWGRVERTKLNKELKVQQWKIDCFTKLLENFKKIINLPSKNFDAEIRELAKPSLKPEHSLYSFRNTLWKHALISYSHENSLTAEQLVDILRGISVRQSSPEDPLERDPIQEIELRTFLDRIRPTLENLLNSDKKFAQSLLKSLSQEKGYVQSDQEWVAAPAFPIYQCGNLQIDLIKGTCGDFVKGTIRGFIPVEFQSNREISQAFTGQNLERTAVEMYKDKSADNYLLQDNKGRSNCVKKENGKLSIYKEIQDGTKNIWVQYVDKEKLFPKPPPVSVDHSDGIWSTFKSTYKAMNQIEESPPRFLTENTEYKFWVDPKKSGEVYVLDGKGELVFKLFFKTSISENVLNKVIDLRLNNPEKYDFGTLKANAHPIWKQLADFESPQDVLVWKKGNRIDRIELQNYGINFTENTEKSGEVVCDGAGAGDLKGWILEDKQKFSRLLQGLPHALVLHSPTNPNLRCVFVPKRSLIATEPAQPGLGLIWTMVKGMLTGTIPEIINKDPLAKKLKFENSKHDQPYFILNIDSAYGLKPGTIEASIYLAQCCAFSHEHIKTLQFILQARKNAKVVTELSEKDLESISALLHTLGDDPDSIALKLQTQLVPKIKNKTEIVQLYKAYLACGKKIDLNFRLSPADELFCLEALKTADIAYYNAHAPLIVERLNKIGEKRAVKHVPAQRSFDNLRSKEASGKKTNFDHILFESMANDPDHSALDLLPYDLTVLSRNFLDLYKTASTQDVGSVDFVRLKTTLESISSEPRYGDYLTILHHYLSTVIEVRSNEKAVKLPIAPTIDLRKTKEPKKLPATLTAFMQELDVFMEAHREPVRDVKQPENLQELQADILAVRRMDDDLQTAEKLIREHSEVNSTELTLEQLEQRVKEITSQPKQTIPSPEIKPSSFALYQPADLQDYFMGNPNPTPLKNFDLSTLKASKEDAIAMAATELETDVDEARRQMGSEIANQKVLIDETARTKLFNKLENKRVKASSSADSTKEEVLKMFLPVLKEVETTKRFGKLQHYIEWESILKHYLQDDVALLKQKFPLVDLQLLTQKLCTYLIHATEVQRIDGAIEEIQNMAQNKEGISAIGSDNLYKLLTNERQYDVNKEPQFLIFEFYFGKLLRENQLILIRDLKPGRLKQAGTGAGKTSVILVLKALMNATGDNLVTLIFPEPLYEENLKNLSHKLGNFFQRNVYALKFDMTRPLVDEKGFSIFKTMYENLMRTTMDKGCVAATRQSLQALEQKWLSLFEQFSEMPRGEKIDPMELEHFRYLTSIQNLMRKRQETILDEFDKVLTPREESHLKLKDSEKDVPEFMVDASLDIFDKLVKIDKLGLQKNLQGNLWERSPADGQAILDDVANDIAQEWAVYKGGDETFIKQFKEYVRGKNEAFISRADINKWDPSDLDKLAVLKDQLSIFLPLTLSKSADVKYVRSKDCIRTVPCKTGTKDPRENAEPEETFERLNYTIQDYYYRGVHKNALIDWIDKLKADARDELAKKRSISMENTMSAQVFKTYFDDEELGKIDASDVARLIDKINNNEYILRKFIKNELMKLKIPTKKITCDGQNLISMSKPKHSSGASATTDNLKGMHRDFNKTEVAELGSTGKMILATLAKSENSNEDDKTKTILTYKPESPATLVSDAWNALKKLPGSATTPFQSVVDGGAALHSIPLEQGAKQLATLGITNVIYCDQGGRQHVSTKQGELSTGVDSTRPNTRGAYLGCQAQSRGTDIQLASSYTSETGAISKQAFLVTANPATETLSDMLQADGRSRKSDHTIRHIIPEGSAERTDQELLQAGLKNSALKDADDLFRSKKQEIRDVIRNDMMQTLLEQASNAITGDIDFSYLLFTYRQFRNAEVAPGQRANILLNLKSDAVEKPGEYFEGHKSIEKTDLKPVEVLTTMKTKFKTLADSLDLKSSSETLETLEYETLQPYLPKGVIGNTSLNMDKEVEVEKETEVETEVEKVQDVESMEVLDAKWPRWRAPYRDEERREERKKEPTSVFKIFSAHEVFPIYDEALSYSVNFMPISRKSEGEYAKFFRTPHDRLQHPVHHLVCRYFMNDDYQKLLADLNEKLSHLNMQSAQLNQKNSVEDNEVEIEKIDNEIETTFEEIAKVQKEGNSKGSWEVIAVDELEFECLLNPMNRYYDSYRKEGDSSVRFLYDVRNKIIHSVAKNKDISTSDTSLKEAIGDDYRTAIERYVIQWCFYNGQYDNYNDKEIALVEDWINKYINKDKTAKIKHKLAKLAQLEDYFLNRVLQYRPNDQEKYPYSQLKSLFDKLRESLTNRDIK